MTIITMRSDNKSKWESSSSITPALGEICYEEDTNTLKIGDGEHKFKDIPTHFATSKELDELIDNNEGKIRSVVNVNRGYDIVSDEEYSNILEAQKRSTFDRSKFTVVGSPTITADGIASGFSGDNYLRRALYDYNFSSSLRINVKAKYLDASKSEYTLFRLYSPVNASLNNIRCVYYPNVHGRQISLFAEFSGANNSVVVQNLGFKNYDDINIKVEITKTKTTVRVYVNDTEFIGSSNWNLSEKSMQSCDLLIGRYSQSYYWAGSIDLKQLSITVDGVEVFNGNKTGVDQIKKDDYELKNQVGTVVVDEDRIASGFGGAWNNKGFVKGVTIPATTVTKNIKYTMRFKTPSETPTDLCTIFGINLCWYLGMNADGRLSLAFPNTYFGETWDNCYSSILELNTWYDIECGQYIDKNNTVQSYLKWKKSSDNNFKISYAHTSLVTKLFHTSSSSYLLMGSYEYGNLPFIGGSIDLNYTKLIIDDQLVYQPTLRIPYTQSKTGNKIVDATYRDRVQDMYEQFGYTHYYTLGDESEKYNVEVVGSPTLVDGVASGFSTSNYLALMQITTDDSSTINVQFTIPNNITDNQGIIGFKSSSSGTTSFGITPSAILLFRSHLGNIFSFKNTLYSAGDLVNVTMDFKNKKAVLNNITKLAIHDVDMLSTYSLTENISTIGYSFLGVFDGSIDLSQFSITVDGKEVYRAYEPAIPDAFTLPTHKPTDIVDYGYDSETGLSYKQRADLTLTQYGQCTSGETVNLLGYKDENSYSVSIPYSGTKSKNSFVADETGGFMAIGKTYL